ncbi:TorF family putative porin, partial [Sandarakinorhabdus sp. DWP1-3-1]|uniref:TorF family putative porin n=1 Tax=Sandarakinorhabdus sp. DWP1-3-1 TaxID=2804627 RepID=UPI003CF83012
MRHIFISAAILAGAVTSPALAADEPTPALKVSGSVALVSDYRFRGVSQSNNGLAVQGGLTLNHESG